MENVVFVEPGAQDRQHGPDGYVPLVTVMARARDVEGVLRELVGTLGALLSGRLETRAPAPTEPRDFGELRVDEAARRVMVSGCELCLTSLEFRLLVALLDRHDQVLTRGELLRGVWGTSASNVTRTVDVHVQRLRNKLGDAGRYIQTVRGAGYRLSVIGPGHDGRERKSPRAARDSGTVEQEAR